MKLVVSVIFALVVWISIYKLFFDDLDDFRKTAKKDSFWAAIDLVFDTNFGGLRFLFFAALGLLGGFLLYNLL